MIIQLSWFLHTMKDNDGKNQNGKRGFCDEITWKIKQLLWVKHGHTFIDSLFTFKQTSTCYRRYCIQIYLYLSLFFKL